MKLTTPLLVPWLVLTCTAGWGQITLREKKAPLEKVLADIEKQTNYVFIYDPDEMKMITITITVKNATLQDTLEKCFKGLSIEFIIVGRNVLLKKRSSENINKNTMFDVCITGNNHSQNPGY